MPPLPTEMDAKQLAITSLFRRTPVKKPTESVEAARGDGMQKPSREEEKEEKTQDEEDADEDEGQHVPLSKRTIPQSQDKRKMVPKKSNRPTITNANRGPLLQPNSPPTGTKPKQTKEVRVEEKEAKLK